MAVAWSPSLTGQAIDHYDVEQCGMVVGAIHTCDATSSSWTDRVEVDPGSGNRLTTSATCNAGLATCVVRIRGVNERGGAGAWHALDLEPWAPFGVSVAPGPSHRSVVVKFSGPTESGAGPTAAKHYRLLVCDGNCGVSSSWQTASDALPYPPVGTAPFTAGTFSCATAVPAIQSVGPRQCQVRMQFVGGSGEVSISSAIGRGLEHG